MFTQLLDGKAVQPPTRPSVILGYAPTAVAVAQAQAAAAQQAAHAQADAAAELMESNDLTYKDVVERFAAEQNVVFMPIRCARFKLSDCYGNLSRAWFQPHAR